MCAWAQWSRNSTFSAGFSPWLEAFAAAGGITFTGIAVRD